MSSKALALTNEERVQMLDDKFIKGEISEEIYKRLLKKYKGDTTEGTKAKPEAKSVQGNLLTNPGFEEGQGNNPTGWIADGSPVTWANEGHSGNRCVVAKVAGWSGWKQNVEFQPGVKYVFSGWMKTSGGEAKAQIVWCNTQPWVYNQAYKYAKLGPTWKRYQLEFTPTGITKTPTSLLLLNEGEKADLYFDDVSLTAVSPSSKEAGTSKPSEAKPVQEVQGNMVQNFSFEKLASGGFAEGWALEDASHGQVAVATSEAHSGNNSMKFSSQNQSGARKASQNLALKPGKKYKVVFWAKGESLQSAPGADGMPCVVNLDYKAKDGKVKPIYIEPKIGNEWKIVAKVVKIPGDAQKGGSVSLRLYCASGTLWIDDVIVVELP